MALKDHLLFMLETNQDVIKRLIDDISEEDSMVQSDHGFNHIRWQVGHLICYDNNSLGLLGGDKIDLGKWEKLFAAGSKISNDPSIYPEMSELKFKIYDLHRNLIAQANKITDADLEKIIGDVDNPKPVWRPVTFFCMHEFYHAGQITQTRRMLGRDRPFV